MVLYTRLCVHACTLLWSWWLYTFQHSLMYAIANRRTVSLCSTHYYYSQYYYRNSKSTCYKYCELAHSFVNAYATLLACIHTAHVLNIPIHIYCQLRCHYQTHLWNQLIMNKLLGEVAEVIGPIRAALGSNNAQVIPHSYLLLILVLFLSRITSTHDIGQST
jgi:hypothetical protein